MNEINLTESSMIPEHLFGTTVKITGTLVYDETLNDGKGSWKFDIDVPIVLNLPNEKRVPLSKPFKPLSKLIEEYEPEPDTGLTSKDMLIYQLRFLMGQSKYVQELKDSGILDRVLDQYMTYNAFCIVPDLYYKMQSSKPYHINAYVIGCPKYTSGQITINNIQELCIIGGNKIWRFITNGVFLSDIELSVQTVTFLHHILNNPDNYIGQLLRVKGRLWFNEHNMSYIIPAQEFALLPDCKDYAIAIDNPQIGFDQIPWSLSYGKSDFYGHVSGPVHIVGEIDKTSDGIVRLVNYQSAVFFGTYHEICILTNRE